MTSLAQIQSEVLTAICDVHRPVPQYIEPSHDGTRRKLRFDIYRNNYYVAAINVLRERFPVAERIVGQDFFKALAREFIVQSPPMGQSNLSFGGELPEFFKNFPPVDDLPYLSDVSRIEWARFRAAIAPDSPSVTSKDFNAISPASAGLLRFEFHPSCRLVTSGHPIYDIWRTNHEDDEVCSLRDSRGGQAVFICRNDNGVEVKKFQPGTVALIENLMNAMPLGAAYEAAGDELTQENFSATLAYLLSSGAISTFRAPAYAQA